MKRHVTQVDALRLSMRISSAAYQAQSSHAGLGPATDYGLSPSALRDASTVPLNLRTPARPQNGGPTVWPDTGG